MIDVPNIPLEDFESIVKQPEVPEIKNEYVGSVQFGVIGSGQAGCRIAKSFYDIGYKKTIALNTSISDLNPLEIPEDQKLLIGNTQGSGKDMGKGEKAAIESSQKVFDLMTTVFKEVDKIIICFGAGGGTGAGSFQTLLEISEKYLKFIGHEDPAQDIIVISALPTSGELQSSIIKKNNRIIQEILEKKIGEGKVGPILFMDNSRIERVYKGIPPIKFWQTINDTITGLFQIFNYLSKQESEYVSFDVEDYKAILKTPGAAVMGVMIVNETEGDKIKLSQAFQDNFKKTLLAENIDYRTAQNCGCIVAANAKILSEIPMEVFNYGFDTIHNLIGSANLHRGLYGTTKKGIRAYTLISGMKFFPPKQADAYS